MGTRGLLCVQKNGEYRVAQYEQYDTDPEQAGEYRLRFLRNINLEALETTVAECEFYTDDELLKCDSTLRDLECGQNYGVKMLRELSACTFEEVLPIIVFKCKLVDTVVSKEVKEQGNYFDPTGLEFMKVANDVCIALQIIIYKLQWKGY